MVCTSVDVILCVTVAFDLSGRGKVTGATLESPSVVVVDDTVVS